MSSLRAVVALFRLLHLGKHQLVKLREMRERLRKRVAAVAVRDCGLPMESERWELERRHWGLHAGFFSLNRRRKKGAFKCFCSLPLSC